jgi:hypothetical protein
MLDKESRRAKSDDPPAWWFGDRLPTHHKNQHFLKCYAGHWNWTDPLEQPKQQKIDMTLDTKM